MFLTICSKSNNYSTLMNKTRIRRIIISLTTSKWPNIIQYLAKCYSIFASTLALRSNTSTSNHHISALPTIRLGYQSFGIRLYGKSLSRNLASMINKKLFVLDEFDETLPNTLPEGLMGVGMGLGQGKEHFPLRKKKFR